MSVRLLSERERLAGIESRLRELQFPAELVVANTSCCYLRCVHSATREWCAPGALPGLED